MNFGCVTWLMIVLLALPVGAGSGADAPATPPAARPDAGQKPSGIVLSRPRWLKVRTTPFVQSSFFESRPHFYNPEINGLAKPPAIAFDQSARGQDRS
jgi:hypothetical protein